MRADGRQNDQLRPIEIIRGFTSATPGSVLIRTGKTHVLCTAAIETAVPEWRQTSGKGWLTSEYDMLPGSTGTRKQRSRVRLDGRTQEIQRLVGRSLRAAVDLARIGSNTIYLDCDVLQADGGTRTAAITGAFVALCDALAAGRRQGLWSEDARGARVAAVSVAVVDNEILLDPEYTEDVRADVDCNLVMTDQGEWIEVQATGERRALRDDQLSAMLALGRRGIRELMEFQQQAMRSDRG
jgi:ribonuclease PH